jgi:hypothetical protein
MIAGPKRLLFWSFTKMVCGTNQATALNAAASHKAGHRIAPVVAARSAFDSAEDRRCLRRSCAWRSAEFSAEDHQNTIQDSSIRHIGQSDRKQAGQSSAGSFHSRIFKSQ